MLLIKTRTAFEQTQLSRTQELHLLQHMHMSGGAEAAVLLEMWLSPTFSTVSQGRGAVSQFKQWLHC